MKYMSFALCSLLLLFGLNTANAASYEIIFKEGAFKFDAAKPAAGVDNKYLASVSIKKDGKVLVNGLRGSTLPDAWIFYQRWNVELKKTSTPSDADIVAMFDYFEKQTADLRKSNAKLGATSLADFAEILDVLNRIPAIKSGTYSFVMGVHKKGESVHGKPHVPRLLGGSLDAPYDAAAPNSPQTTIGGFIRTLNKNNAQNQKKVAAGINVHDGRRSKDYKDSEGCLTIRPEDWETFYRALPSPKEWAEGKHVGIVALSRG